METYGVTAAGCEWLTPVILGTQEAKIKNIVVLSQPGANSSWDPILKKKKAHKKRAGGVAQGVGPEFKPQYDTHKKVLTIWGL
jgi:hypothetical protein